MIEIMRTKQKISNFNKVLDQVKLSGNNSKEIREKLSSSKLYSDSNRIYFSDSNRISY